MSIPGKPKGHGSLVSPITVSVLLMCGSDIPDFDPSSYPKLLVCNAKLKHRTSQLRSPSTPVTFWEAPTPEGNLRSLSVGVTKDPAGFFDKCRARPSREPVIMPQKTAYGCNPCFHVFTRHCRQSCQRAKETGARKLPLTLRSLDPDHMNYSRFLASPQDMDCVEGL